MFTISTTSGQNPNLTSNSCFLECVSSKYHVYYKTLLKFRNLKLVSCTIGKKPFGRILICTIPYIFVFRSVVMEGEPATCPQPASSVTAGPPSVGAATSRSSPTAQPTLQDMANIKPGDELYVQKWRDLQKYKEKLNACVDQAGRRIRIYVFQAITSDLVEWSPKVPELSL